MGICCNSVESHFFVRADETKKLILQKLSLWLTSLPHLRLTNIEVLSLIFSSRNGHLNQMNRLIPFFTASSKRNADENLMICHQ